MAPSAPGLLSTTKRWPRSASTPGAMVRKIASETLPAAKGMTTRTGFEGHSWESPIDGASAVAAIATMCLRLMSPHSRYSCASRFYKVGMNDARRADGCSLRVHRKHMSLAYRGGGLPQAGRGCGLERCDRRGLGRHARLPRWRASGSPLAGDGGAARVRPVDVARAQGRARGLRALRPARRHG